MCPRCDQFPASFRLTILLLLIFLFSPFLLAQERKSFIVSFHSVHGLILLDAKVNGKSAALLLDTGANNSIIDAQSAGFDTLVPDKVHETGAVIHCVFREVNLTLGRYNWPFRSTCLVDLTDTSKRMGVRLDGFIGQDILQTFSVVCIDYRAHTVSFEE